MPTRKILAVRWKLLLFCPWFKYAGDLRNIFEGVLGQHLKLLEIVKRETEKVPARCQDIVGDTVGGDETAEGQIKSK
jgi:hypothetical protein